MTKRQGHPRFLAAVAEVDRHFPLVSFGSAEEFLEALPDNAVGCVLLDVLLLPNMGGHRVLMQELENRDIVLPVVLLTGHADVQALAIQAIRSGVFDVVEKPYKDKLLVERLRQALTTSQKWREVQAERKGIAERLETLTRREREVMGLLVTGMKNKMIAEHLGISRKTLDIHRSKVMGKMKARTVADLVNWAYLDNPGMLRTRGAEHQATGLKNERLCRVLRRGRIRKNSVLHARNEKTEFLANSAHPQIMAFSTITWCRPILQSRLRRFLKVVPCDDSPAYQFASAMFLLLPLPCMSGDDFKLEPGFTLLFNGKNLGGWKEVGNKETLDGKTEAYQGRFKVVDGEARLRSLGEG